MKEIVGPTQPSNQQEATVDEGLLDQEAKEKEPLRGRRVLVTGGATGTGFATALMLHQLGAEVVVGTRNKNHFAEAFAQLKGERVHPFIADLTKTHQVQRAMQNLIDQDIVPTDIVHSAAAGMDPFLPGLMLQVARLKRIQNQPQFQEQLRAFKENIPQWVAEAEELAMNVNYHGPVAFMEAMKELLPHGSKIIVYSSFWSTFYDQVQVPSFYEGVADSKNKFEGWITEQTPELVSRGVYPAIVSRRLILDSNVGKAYQRFLRFLLSDEEQPSLESFPTMADMVEATVEILKSDPGKWAEIPLRRYVCGPGDIRSKLSPEEEIFQYPLPL